MIDSDEFLPIVVPLNPPPDPERALLQFAALPRVVFFDSARRDPRLGRYSFLAADPFSHRERSTDDAGTLSEIERWIAPYSMPRRADLPPFQGGLAGLFSYDLNRQLERVAAPSIDEFHAPFVALGLYDVVLALDHVQGKAWLISQGFPETDPAARRNRAEERARQFLRLLEAPAGPPWLGPSAAESPIAPSELAPQFETGRLDRLTSNFSRGAYLAAIERAIEYIRAGDIFQVNLAQRLLYPAHDDALSLYLRLRRRNPATFAGYLATERFQIASASPERFVKVVDGAVETRPIKGTRLRTTRPEADLFAGDDLLQSEKDRSENVMIVDLLRNDLSRVCRPESVVVSQLCALEVYEFVQHLVSVVEGKLAAGCTAVDLLRASFPGGSITGAPKIRAMEIIAELEPTARGPYCGCLAYRGFDGSWDSSILIRTITAGRGWWQAPVGGGIVSQSEPEHEYAETWHKAVGIMRALV